MIQGKYKRMTFSAWLNVELEQCSLVFSVFAGLLMVSGCIAVRTTCGSPYSMILQLGIKELLPPVWLLSGMRFLSMLTAGCAAGIVLSNKRKAGMVEKYKGGMFFVMLAVLELLWYPTLFYWGLILLVLIECACMLALSVAVSVCFLRVSRLAGYVAIAHTVWVLYLLVLAFAILLRN